MYKSPVIFIACAFLFLAAGCKADGSAHSVAVDSSARPGVASVQTKGEGMLSNEQPRREAELPPAADSVLYLIYGVDGDGATSYEIENGSVATYWYGYEFDIAGQHYFTGFAYDTPEKYEKNQEQDYPDPAAQVTLTQATFLRAKPGESKPWAFWGAQRSVGSFGGYEKADEIDRTRKTLSHVLARNILVLAIPTKRAESGILSTGYAIFTFNPERSDVEAVKPWRYLGTVMTGEDNSDACDDGAVIPCVVNSGDLAFAESASGGLPDILVSRKGKEMGGGGVVREIAHGDVVRYRYKADGNEYVAVP